MLLFAALLLAGPVAPPPVRVAPVLPPDGKPFYRAHASPACGDWSTARAGGTQENIGRSAVYRMWVEGYVTGFNMVGPDQSGDLVGGHSHDEMYSAVDGYCARNPSHMVVDAMGPVADAYLRRRLQGAPLDLPAPGSKRKAMATVVTTCRNWNEDRNPLLRIAYGNVVRGYLTAYNRWGPDPSGDAIGAEDSPIVEEWIDDWCRDRSSTLLIQAVPQLVAHVASERAAGRLPPGGRRPTDLLTQGGVADR